MKIGRSAILGSTLHPKGWEAIQSREADMEKPAETFFDLGPQSPPVFTKNLVSMDHLVEGQSVHLEAQVEPKTDPNLRVEWFKNGVALGSGKGMPDRVEKKNKKKKQIFHPMFTTSI
jgi:hypothetical protein